MLYSTFNTTNICPKFQKIEGKCICVLNYTVSNMMFKNTLVPYYSVILHNFDSIKKLCQAQKNLVT